MKSSVTVFVCGTYADLSAERGAVLDAIQRLQLQHHSMEFFGARPERPIETCFAEVRKSDVLVVIVGHRYGTLVPGLQISFSEAEYEEACRLNKPCLVYILDSVDSQGTISEQEDQRGQLLERWKATLRARHTVAAFQDGGDLALQVAVDLGREINKLEKTAFLQDSSNSTALATERCGIRIRVRSSQKFGDQERQLLHSLTTDPTGNIVIVGGFWGTIDFGGSKLTSAGDRDIFIGKFDPEGGHLWSKRYGDEAEQVGVGADTDTAGGIYLVSAFAGTLAFGGDVLVSKGRYNVALAKLDSTGSHVWSRCFGDTQYHVPECIAVSPSGSVVIAGRFQGSIDFGGGSVKSNSRQTDIFLAAFSPAGEYLWAKRLGGPYEQQTRSLAIGSDGTIALVGAFKRAIDFDGSNLSQQHADDYCGFLTTFDEHGKTLWCKRFGEPYVEQGSVVAFDRRNGDLLAAGMMRKGFPAGASDSVTSICLLARYDPAGLLRWSKAFGTHAFPNSIAVESNGRILLTGHFQGLVDFGMGPLVSAGGYDMFAAMFTADGSVQWSSRFGDQRHQFLIKGTHGYGGSIVLAGSFHGTIDFGTGPLVASGYDGIQEGTEDVFLAILEDDC